MLLQPQSHICTLITLIWALMKKMYMYMYVCIFIIVCENFIFFYTYTVTLYLVGYSHQCFEIHVVYSRNMTINNWMRYVNLSF